jgi:hypothetical protein
MEEADSLTLALRVDDLSMTRYQVISVSPGQPRLEIKRCPRIQQDKLITYSST